MLVKLMNFNDIVLKIADREHEFLQFRAAIKGTSKKWGPSNWL